MAWAWWLGAALVLAVIEILSLDLVLIMFAGGALLATVLALVNAPLWVQIVGFGVASTLLLVTLRPYLLRHMRGRVPLIETNAAGLVGRTAVVVSRVTSRSGRVKLGGEVWTARTENDEVVEEGVDVLVLRIAGATAVVTARVLPGPATGPWSTPHEDPAAAPTTHDRPDPHDRQAPLD